MTKKYTITHEKNICIGCWACANVNPKHWEMEEEDEVKSHLIGSEKVDDKEILELEEDFEENMEAAEVCPVNCIHIDVDEERKI